MNIHQNLSALQWKMSDSSVQTFHEAQRPSFPLRYEPLTI